MTPSTKQLHCATLALLIDASNRVSGHPTLGTPNVVMTAVEVFKLCADYRAELRNIKTRRLNNMRTATSKASALRREIENKVCYFTDLTVSFHFAPSIGEPHAVRIAASRRTLERACLADGYVLELG